MHRKFKLNVIQLNWNCVKILMVLIGYITKFHHNSAIFVKKESLVNKENNETALATAAVYQKEGR